MNPKRRRRVRIIKPRLQWKLIGYSVFFVLAALLVQGLALSYSINELALSMRSEGALVMKSLGPMLANNLLVSLLILVPIVVGLGIWTTHRLAGPLYRMEKHLKELAQGEIPPAIRLRKGDDLKDFCESLNQATERVRAMLAEKTASEEESRDAA